MKKIFILLLLIFFGSNSFAQFWKEPKNLKQAVEILNEKANDSDKEKIKNTPDEKLTDLNFSSFYCKEIYNWVRKENNTKLCKFLFSKGIVNKYNEIVLVSFKSYLKEGKFDQESIIEKYRKIEDRKLFEYKNRFTLDTIGGLYIPINIYECISELDKMLSDTTKKSIINMSEDDFVSNAHFGLGMYLRNGWGLWGGSRLSKYFNDIGISQPDDMSTIIFESYHRYLNKIEIKLGQKVGQNNNNAVINNEEKQKKMIDSLFAYYNIGDTVFYQYAEGYINKEQYDKYADDICIAKGLIVKKRSEDWNILVKLIEACDSKGIIIYNPMLYDEVDSKHRKTKILKKNKTGWFWFCNWSKSHSIN